MNLKYTGRSFACMMVFAFFAGAATLAAQTSTTIDVTDSRPLVRALDALEVFLGVTINYEDPPYENISDLQDFSNARLRVGHPDGYQVLGPRVGRVTAEVYKSAGKPSDSDVIDDINALLSSYRQNALPGDFDVLLGNGVFYVTPTNILGANMSTREVTSPFATLVTIPNAKRTVADAVRTILDAVQKATGLKIGIASLPFWPSDVVSFGATGEPANTALVRLLGQTGEGSFSYRLLFDPKPNPRRPFDYMIRIQRSAYVPPQAPPGLGPIVVAPTIGPQHSSSGRPGFAPAK